MNRNDVSDFNENGGFGGAEEPWGDAAGSKVDTYEPKIQITNKKGLEEEESFWDHLVREAEEADTAGPKIIEAPDDTETEEPELTPEQHYDKLMGVITNKPSHREILLRVLAMCREEQEFGAVEEAIQGYPEYLAAGQNPYRLIKHLIDGGGLVRLPMDEGGVEVTIERQVGLTEDEVDDLIACFHLKTTKVGTQIAEDLSAERRLTNLFEMFTDRVSFYTELLDFCKEPRTFKEIEALFSGRDFSGLRTLHPESGLAIKPTVFVDNMEKAGAIVWKKEGWVLTKEGGAYLEAIVSGSA